VLPRRTAAVLVVLSATALVLPLPAAAGSAHPSYRLKKGKCRNGYLHQYRRVNGRRQAWCVYARPPTATHVTTIGPNPPGVYFILSGGIYYGRGYDMGGGTELRGQPITYTVKDDTTQKRLGSFRLPSNADASCTIVNSLSVDGMTTTIMGQAVGPWPACPLAPVTMPAGDIPGITGIFAGNAAYGPSRSSEAGI
jgi:hypothetical protein